MRPLAIFAALLFVALAVPALACPTAGAFYGTAPCEIGPPVGVGYGVGVNYGFPAVGFAPAYSTFIPQPRLLLDPYGQVRLANHRLFFGAGVHHVNRVVAVNRGNVSVAVGGAGANVRVRNGFFGATRVRVR